MTMTESRPDASSGTASVPGADASGGLAGWFSTGDHKRLGRLYIVFSALLVVGGLVVAFLLGLEKGDPSGYQILGSDTIGQLFSLYGVGTVFLGVLPLLLGIAIYVVPLQLGARTIAFPRAAAASFWAWLVGSGLVITAYAANGGPGGGRSRAVDLFIAALGLVILALLTAAISIATTVLVARTPGLALGNVPVFAWSALVQAVMLLVTLPVLLANLVLVYVDHHYARVYFGGNAGLGSQIAWATGQPQLYVYGVGVLGFAAEVAAVFGQARLKLQPVVLGAIALFGVLGFGAFAQAKFQPSFAERPVNLIMAIGAILPVLIVIGAVLATLRTGKPKLGAPLLYAMGSLVLLLGATVMGALTFVHRLHLEGTVWQTAHYNAVVAAALLSGLGALAYWGPKMTGHRASERALGGLAVLGILASLTYVAADAINGAIHQPLDIVDYTTGNRALNTVAAIAAVVLGVVIVDVLLVVGRSIRKGAAVGADPWGGHTLEWFTTSPPPPGNFSQPVGLIESDRPLLDRQEASA